MTIGIPMRLGHVWIGPYAPPIKWMNTWRVLNPHFAYTLYDNEFLHSFRFRTKPLIDEYIRRGQYAGVADLMRLEILFEYGGVIAEADSICVKPISELYKLDGVYTVYEHEFIRGKLVSPIHASSPRNRFVGIMIDELLRVNPVDLEEPWVSTGNLFTARMIDKYKPHDITIFPSCYFIPMHFTGVPSFVTGPVYARQLFGTTRHAYGKLPLVTRITSYIRRYGQRRYNRMALERVKGGRLRDLERPD